MKKNDDRVWGTDIGGLLNEYAVAHMAAGGMAGSSARCKRAQRALVREIRRRLRGEPDRPRPRHKPPTGCAGVISGITL